MYIVERQVSRHGHYVGVIMPDEYPANPLVEWDTLADGMVYSRYRRDVCGTQAVDPDDFALPKGAVALPVYSNDSTGECFAGSEPVTSWESGVDALVYVTREKILKEYNCKYVTKRVRDRVIKCLKAEVQMYSAYRSGDVYDFIVYAVPADTDLEKLADCRLSSFDVYDPCGGYYALQDCADAMRESLDAADDAKQAELDAALDAELVDCM